MEAQPWMEDLGLTLTFLDVRMDDLHHMVGVRWYPEH